MIHETANAKHSSTSNTLLSGYDVILTSRKMPSTENKQLVEASREENITVYDSLIKEFLNRD